MHCRTPIKSESSFYSMLTFSQYCWYLLLLHPKGQAFSQMDEDGDGLIPYYLLISIMDDNDFQTTIFGELSNYPFWREFSVAMRRHWLINQYSNNSGATNQAELLAQFIAIQQKGASTCKKKGDTGMWKCPNEDKEINCDSVCDVYWRDCAGGADEDADFCAVWNGDGANDDDVMIVSTGMIK